MWEGEDREMAARLAEVVFFNTQFGLNQTESKY